jgi:hypothetical protein
MRKFEPSVGGATVRFGFHSGCAAALLLIACSSSNSPPGSNATDASIEGTPQQPDASIPPISPTHVLTLQVIGGGLIENFGCPTICNHTFPDGMALTLNARPFTDWRFAGWSGACSGVGSCLLEMRSDASVVATFEHVADGECTGLTPLDPGAPWTASFPAPSQVYSCVPGAVDGNGAVGIGGERADGTVVFAFFTSDGKPQSTREYQSRVQPRLYPQNSGFLVVTTEATGLAVYSLASDGSERNHLRNLSGAGRIAVNAAGELVVVTNNSIELLDATFASRWSVSIADIVEGRYAVGMDHNGHVLLLFDGRSRFENTDVAGLWVTHDGHRGAIFPAIPLKYRDTVLELSPRVGGGFWVLEIHEMSTDWLMEVDSLATTSSPPPAWLHWTKPTPVRNERGYALFPDTFGAFSPTCTLEVTSLSGKGCGVLQFDDPSQSCDSRGQLIVGVDGTLVQSLRPAQNCGSNCACTWRVWRGYFR